MGDTVVAEVQGFLKWGSNTPAFVKEMKDVGKKARELSGKLSDAGGELSKNLTLPLTAFAGGVTFAFGSFDQAMTQSTAIMTGLSEDMKSKLADRAREVALTVGASATQTAESYYFLASAGLDAAASIEALPVVANFAQAGMFNMALATDLLTDAQSALGLTIKDDVVANTQNMIRVSDVLVKANTIANASVEQFSVSLTTKAGTAMRELGIEIEDGVAVLAAWADQGVKAELAGERFNIVTRDMQTAAIKNADAFRAFGIEVFDASGNFRNMSDIIFDMETALTGMSAEQRKTTLMLLGFTDRSVQATQSLLGLSGRIRDYSNVLKGAQGITDEVARKQLTSLWAKVGLLKDRFLDAAITIGGSLQPAFEILLSWGNKLADGMRFLAEKFSNLPTGIKVFVVALGGIVAAIGPVLLIASSLVSAWGAIAVVLPVVGTAINAVLAFITGPIGLVAAASALLLSWEPARTFLIDLGKNVFSTLRDWVSRIIAEFKIWWDSTKDGRTFLLNLVKVITKEWVSSLKLSWSWVKNISDVVITFIANLLGARDGTELLSKAFKFWIRAIKETWIWVKSLTTKILGFSDKLGVVLDVVKLMNPSMELAITKFQEWVAEAKAMGDTNIDEDMQGIKDSLDAVADSMIDVNDSFTETTDDFGRNADSITNAFDGVTDSVKFWGSSMEGTIDLTDQSAKAFSDHSEEAENLDKKMKTLRINFDTTRITLEDFRKHQLDLSTAWRDGIITTEEYEDAIKNLRDRMNSTVGVTASVKDQFKGLADSILQNSGLMTDAIGSIFGDDISNAVGQFVNSFSNGFASARDSGLGFVDSLRGGMNNMLQSVTGTMAGISAGMGAMDGSLQGLLTGAMSAFANFQSGNVVGGIAASVGVAIGVFDKLFGSNKRSIDEVRDSFRGYVDDIISGENAIRSMGQAFTDFKELVSRDTGAAAEEFRENFGSIVDSVLSDIDSTRDSIAGVFESFAGISFVKNMVGEALYGGLGSDVIEQQLDKVKNKFFEVMNEMRQFMTDQSTAMIDGVIAAFSDFSNATARDIAFAEESILSAFNTMIDAGVPVLDAIAKIGPAFQQISDRGSELGIELSGEFSRLGEVFDILSDQKLQKAIDRLSDIGTTAEAAGNLGILSASQFDYFGDQIRQTFEKLVAGGLTSQEALAQLSGPLQLLYDQQQMYGYAIDDSTQGLIDQAIEQGRLADKGLDTNDILIAGFERMLEGINRLIAALGGVPVAFDGWIESVDDMATETRYRLQGVADEANRTGRMIDDALDRGGYGGGATGGGGGGSAGGGGGGTSGGGGRRGGYQSGSQGFIDFGRESIVAVHGREEIITYDQGESVAGMVASAINQTMSRNVAGSENAEMLLREQIREMRATNEILVRLLGVSTETERNARMANSRMRTNGIM